MKLLTLNSVKKKIIIPLTLLLLPLFLVAFVFIEYAFRSHIRESQVNRLTLSAARLDQDVKRIMDKALLLSAMLATVKGVEEAYDIGNNQKGRAFLRQVVKPYFEKIKNDLHIAEPKVHYHQKPAISFLRTWVKPGGKDGGDDLSGFRKSVLYVTGSLTPVTTVEVGRGGLVLRGISPVVKNGACLGSIETLHDFDEVYKLMDTDITMTVYLNKKYRGTIDAKVSQRKDPNTFKSEAGDFIYLSSSNKTIPGFVDDPFIAGFGSGGKVFEQGNTFAVSVPLKGYDGDTVALMLLSYDAGKEMKRLAYMRAILGLVFLTIIIVVFALVLIIGTRLGRSVKKIVSAFSDIADGDLNTAVAVDSNDEIGILAASMNKMVEDLSRIVSNIINAAGRLQAASESIAQGNQDLSRRTSEQAASIEEIASTIEESAASINQNAQNAGLVRDMSRRSNELAKEGGKVVGEAVVAIRDISESSGKIGDIIQVINEIAFQTNLLALNAAVEAARAGEAGRGFAVVAGEVRNLAQRSGNAAKEIESLIRDSLDKVDRGAGLVAGSGESIKRIVESIENVSKLIEEIAASSNEQKDGIEQISTAITDMDSMTQNNASMVEETAASSEELESQARELMELIGHFRTGEAMKAKDAPVPRLEWD